VVSIAAAMEAAVAMQSGLVHGGSSGSLSLLTANFAASTHVVTSSTAAVVTSSVLEVGVGKYRGMGRQAKE
jgi:hypothetical protein